MTVLTKREVAAKVINEMPLGKWQFLQELVSKTKTTGGYRLMNNEMAGFLAIAKRMGILQHDGHRKNDPKWRRDIWISRWKRVSRELFC